MRLSLYSHGRLLYDPPRTEWEHELGEVLCSSPTGVDGDPSYDGFTDEEEWI